MVSLSKTAVDTIFRKVGIKATLEAKKEFKIIIEKVAKEIAGKSVKIAKKSKRRTVLDKDIRKVELGEEKKEVKEEEKEKKKEENGRGKKA